MPKWINITSLILLIILWGFTGVHYQDLPANIPIHFNALGEPDNFGSRIHSWGIPIIASLLYVLLSQISTRKKIHSQEVKIIAWLKLGILFLFAYLQVNVFLVSLGQIEGLGVGFLPFSIVLLLVPSIVVMFQKKGKDR